MSTVNALRWMLWREYLDQRQNRMLWPVYVVMPLIGAALPAILALASAKLLSGSASLDGDLTAMLGTIRRFASAANLELERASAVFLLRLASGYFLLMPLAIVSIAGAYAIVGEKQQRTLEPVLATPLTTRDFLLAKLVAVVAPAVLVSWIAALLGAIASVVAFRIEHGLVVWPDRFYWVAVLVLAPEIAALTGLVCLRVSARMQDPQAANQTTALVLVPLLLIAFAVAGPRSRRVSPGCSPRAPWASRSSRPLSPGCGTRSIARRSCAAGADVAQRQRSRPHSAGLRTA